jgi:HAD superfamily hydrolase (TIGR01509 family)
MRTVKKSIRDYRGALFDLDGTLADSMGLWDPICRDWLIAKGKTPEANLEEKLAMMTLNQSAKYVGGQYGFTLSPAEIITQWEGMVLEKYKTSVPLKQETAAMVRSLHSAGAKLAIVSSCFPAACEAFLDRWELRPYFSALVYTDEAPGDKSMPDIWLLAAERLGISPADCVVFEDLYGAIRGVRAAGMDFAAVYDASCRKWEAMQAEADWVVG